MVLCLLIFFLNKFEIIKQFENLIKYKGGVFFQPKEKEILNFIHPEIIFYFEQ